VILAEPPKTADDVLAVLIQLDNMLDLASSGDPLGFREMGHFHEIISVA
jgi:hypothetical protein